MKKLSLIGIIALSLTIVSCGGNKKADANKEGAETTQSAENPVDPSAVSTPINLTTAEFLEKVVNYEANPTEWQYLGDKPCIVDFWATWCPPCKVIAPTLEELAKEYAGQIYVYKVDVDKEPQLAAAFGIQSIPTLLFIPMSGNPQSEMGAIPKEAFKDKIDNFLLVNN